MTDLIRNTVSAPALRRTPMRPLTRMLVVAVAVGFIGVGIDLMHGRQANALPKQAVQGPALASMSVDHSVVSQFVDEPALEPGASVAAYSSPTLDPGDKAPAPAMTMVVDGDAPDPGASVAAYGN